MNSVGALLATLINFMKLLLPLLSTLKVDQSYLMWLYRNKNVILGIPVSLEAKDLPLNTFLEVRRALQLKATAKVWTGYLSPAQLDYNNINLYALLKSKLLEGCVSVLNELRHFCADLNKVMVILTYTELSYELNLRFSYLKLELKNV